MLGHKLVQKWHERFKVSTTFRGSSAQFKEFGFYDKAQIFENVNGENIETILRVLADVKPDAVVNCIGVIKQLKDAKNPIPGLTINALFPHRLALACRASGARLIAISTDCVFNGKKGNYREDDFADAEDLYGRTKFLGEVSAENCLTLRTSIIGREIGSAHSLVEWFLSNRGGKVKGFTKAIYTGFPTVVFADILANLLENHPQLSGLWQVSSEPINKYELLKMIRDEYNIEIEIEPSADLVIDRSLNSEKFRRETGFQPKSWAQMVKEMVADF